MEGELEQETSVQKLLKDAVDRSRNLTDDPKQVIRAALAGLCIASFVAMSSQPQLDRALTIAAIAFAVALPILVFAFIGGLREVVNPDEIGRSAGIAFVQAVNILAYLADIPGELFTAIGVGAIVFHLSTVAGFALVGTIVITLLVACVGGVARMVKLKKPSTQ